METIHDFVTNDPRSFIIMSFILGFLLNQLNWGIIYLILFLIFWEILYFGYLDCNNYHYSFQYRMTLISAGILGFLLGRWLHDDDDHFGSCKDFCKDIKKYREDCGC